jgi:hypothetical protein
VISAVISACSDLPHPLERDVAPACVAVRVRAHGVADVMLSGGARLWVGLGARGEEVGGAARATVLRVADIEAEVPTSTLPRAHSTRTPRGPATAVAGTTAQDQRREGAPLCVQDVAVIGAAWVVESAGNRWWMESTAPQYGEHGASIASHRGGAPPSACGRTRAGRPARAWWASRRRALRWRFCQLSGAFLSVERGDLLTDNGGFPVTRLRFRHARRPDEERDVRREVEVGLFAPYVAFAQLVALCTRSTASGVVRPDPGQPVGGSGMAHNAAR